MSSSAMRARRPFGTTLLLVLALAVAGDAVGPRFFPDDPIRVDDDAALDASSPIEPTENSPSRGRRRFFRSPFASSRVPARRGRMGTSRMRGRRS